ncbi:MAG: polysaccharide deacetylase family protein [Nitrospirota bacterium]
MPLLFSAGKQHLAASLLSGTGLLNVARFVRRRASRGLTIFAYHRVLTHLPSAFSFDPEVVSAFADDFERQARHIQRHCTPMTFAEVRELEDAGRPFPPHAVILTFDDGYKDNATVVAPILKRCGIPATFFITTGYLTDRRLFWWDEAANIIWKCALPLPPLPEFGLDARALASMADRPSIIRAVLRRCHQLPDDQRVDLIRRLAALTGVHPDHGAADAELLTWEDVAAMAEDGFEIGSHTVTHPVLTRVDAARQDAELTDSKRILEQRLNRRIEVFAYPVGAMHCVSEALAARVKAAGYRYAVTYIGGTNQAIGNPYALRRQHVGLDTTGPTFQASLVFPELFQ